LGMDPFRALVLTLVKVGHCEIQSRQVNTDFTSRVSVTCVTNASRSTSKSSAAGAANSVRLRVLPVRGNNSKSSPFVRYG
jgi:hypothetical protein